MTTRLMPRADCLEMLKLKKKMAPKVKAERRPLKDVYALAVKYYILCSWHYLLFCTLLLRM